MQVEPDDGFEVVSLAQLIDDFEAGKKRKTRDLVHDEAWGAKPAYWKGNYILDSRNGLG